MQNGIKKEHWYLDLERDSTNTKERGPDTHMEYSRRKTQRETDSNLFNEHVNR